VVAGDNARNVIQQIPPDPLIVRVEDNERIPVPGATVTFSAPPAGASGQFADGSTMITVVTDMAGIARVEGFHPNAIAGSYQILVRAQYQGETALAALRQTNIEARGGHGKLIAILSIAGAAAGAAFIAKRKNGTEAPTITFGGEATVGAPRR
jgi:hypothetical protein